MPVNQNTNYELLIVYEFAYFKILVAFSEVTFTVLHNLLNAQCVYTRPGISRHKV